MAARDVAIEDRIVAFCVSFIDEHGYPPTLEEIGTGVHRVKSVVKWHLNRLEKEGRVRRGKKWSARTLQILQPGLEG